MDPHTFDPSTTPIPFDGIDNYPHWSKQSYPIQVVYPEGATLDQWKQWLNKIDTSEYSQFDSKAFIESLHWLSASIPYEHFRALLPSKLHDLERALIAKPEWYAPSPWPLQTLIAISNACWSKDQLPAQTFKWLWAQATAQDQLNELSAATLSTIQQHVSPKATGLINKNRHFLKLHHNKHVRWAHLPCFNKIYPALQQAFEHADMDMGFHLSLIKEPDSKYVKWLKENNIAFPIEKIKKIIDDHHFLATNISSSSLLDVYLNYLPKEQHAELLQHIADKKIPLEHNNPINVYKTWFANNVKHEEVTAWCIRHLPIDVVHPAAHSQLNIAIERLIQTYHKDTSRWQEWLSYMEKHKNNDTLQKWITKARRYSAMIEQNDNAMIYALDMENPFSYSNNVVPKTLEQRKEWLVQFYQSKTMHEKIWGNLSDREDYQRWRKRQTTLTIRVAEEFRWMNPLLASAAYWFPEHQKFLFEFELKNQRLPQVSYLEHLEKTLVGVAIDWKKELQDAISLITEFDLPMDQLVRSILERHLGLHSPETTLDTSVIDTLNAT